MIGGINVCKHFKGDKPMSFNVRVMNEDGSLCIERGYIDRDGDLVIIVNNFSGEGDIDMNLELTDASLKEVLNGNFKKPTT